MKLFSDIRSGASRRSINCLAVLTGRGGGMRQIFTGLPCAGGPSDANLTPSSFV